MQITVGFYLRSHQISSCYRFLKSYLFAAHLGPLFRCLEYWLPCLIHRIGHTQIQTELKGNTRVGAHILMRQRRIFPAQGAFSSNSIAQDGSKPTAAGRSLRRVFLSSFRMQMAWLGSAALGLLLGLPAGLGLAYLAWEWVSTKTFFPSQEITANNFVLLIKVEKVRVSFPVTSAARTYYLSSSKLIKQF